MKVTFGIDKLLAEPEKYLQGRRFAMLVNQSSVAADARYSFERLIAAGFIPEKIFAPEHGMFGTEQDQMTISSVVDAFTGLKAVSLYGQTRKDLKPSAPDLEDIDTLVVDIQDIGCRYYTYSYTMAFCIEVCAQLGIRVIICDRPNPLGGVVVEGGIVHPDFDSFVGAYPLAVRHSLTIGEIATLLNIQENWRADLQIVALDGWQRSMLYGKTGGLWVQPSPNMPTFDTAMVYPGTCLFEGTNMSEGRGTTRPFETIGAPYVDAKQYAAELNAKNLPGVTFRPLYFKPTFHKFKDQQCGGVFIHVSDTSIFQPYFTGLVMVKTAYDMYPTEFEWRSEPYEYIAHIPAIDLLTGSAQFRSNIETGGDLSQYVINYKQEEIEFAKIAASASLYE